MKHLVDSVLNSLDNENYYAALFLSLTLPDICCKLQFGGKTSGEKYASWFKKYLHSKYSQKVGPDLSRFPFPLPDDIPPTTKKVFLSGKDCYALRCALLHEGSDDITTQKREILYKFYFSINGGHCNYYDNCHINGRVINSTLQLNVQKFCKDMCQAVESWLSDVKNDVRIMNEIDNTIKIYDSSDVFQLWKI